MTRFRNVVFWLMAPMHLVAYAWLTFGRGLFGCTVGWIGLIFMFAALPSGASLVLTTMLLVRRRLPAAFGRLSTAQAMLHVGLWTMLFIGGLAVVDYTDSASSSDTSVLNRLTGLAAEDHRWTWLLLTTLLASLVLWCVILTLAIVQQSARPPIDRSVSLSGWAAPAPRSPDVSDTR